MRFFAGADRRSDFWSKLSVVARAWAAAAARGQPTETLVAEAGVLLTVSGYVAMILYPGANRLPADVYEGCHA